MQPNTFDLDNKTPEERAELDRLHSQHDLCGARPFDAEGAVRQPNPDGSCD